MQQLQGLARVARDLDVPRKTRGRHEAQASTAMLGYRARRPRAWLVFAAVLTGTQFIGCGQGGSGATISTECKNCKEVYDKKCILEVVGDDAATGPIVEDLSRRAPALAVTIQVSRYRVSSVNMFAGQI